MKNKASLFLSVIIIIMLFATGCSANLAHKASIYNFGSIEYSEDHFSYINSTAELNDYYDSLSELNDPYDSLFDTNIDDHQIVKEVFKNKDYDENFFKDNCLLIFFHYLGSMPQLKFQSLELVDDILVLNIQQSIVANDVTCPIYIVIELDKEYSGKDVKLEEHVNSGE